jgi:hypothetical protein
MFFVLRLVVNGFGSDEARRLSVMREGSEPETNFVLLTGGERCNGGVVDFVAPLRGRAVVASTPPGPSLQRLTHRHCWRELMLLDSAPGVWAPYITL